MLNKHRFIALKNIASKDQLLTVNHSIVHLFCANGKSSHCGQYYRKNTKPIKVYNLELYQRHNYYVGNKQSLLVHNNCFIDEIHQVRGAKGLLIDRGGGCVLFAGACIAHYAFGIDVQAFGNKLMANRNFKDRINNSLFKKGTTTLDTYERTMDHFGIKPIGFISYESSGMFSGDRFKRLIGPPLNKEYKAINLWFSGHMASMVRADGVGNWYVSDLDMYQYLNRHYQEPIKTIEELLSHYNNAILKAAIYY